jgi:hypothetical protein
MELQPVTCDSPRGQILEALGHCNAEAKRLHPSPHYEMVHAYLDQLLTWLEDAG